MAERRLRAVADTVSFPKLEEEILECWTKERTFARCLEKTSGNTVYKFYDGPPFATGLPHYGHLLAGTIKDVIPRFWTMRGYHVERRFGWDCHGLPVEYEIDTALKLKTRKEREAYGVARYNKACRDIVLRYTKEWERIVVRMGRWVDFRNDYKTMDLHFMESVWWVFKQLWDKGLIYEGYKVLPFSTAVSTPLSNFEASQNYKEVVDPAITVAFPLKDDRGVKLLAWTTTPWTLPSNLALTVGADIDYAQVRDESDKSRYILAKSRIAQYFKSADEFTIEREWKGSELVGKTYLPLFDYFSDRADRGAFRIISGAFVTTEDGTGIVHTAPGFGEDDFQVCREAGIDVVCPVDDDGRFTDEVWDFVGIYVKDADKEIIKKLKAAGLLVHQGTVKHNYPFCWRSETPLIYKAVSTWFVKVEAIKPALLAANKQTKWVPEVLRDGRFGNWLENARDWAISRDRFWGNPLPIWKSEDGSETICIGSIAELFSLTGKKITDLHREHIDDLVVTSQSGKTLSRVPEVLDCWFESGSMPFGENHYPFSRTDLDSFFPADFIAEGLDQTRGWFYTLMVLSSALYGKPAFKNVVVNGLVLAADGKKMSKRLKNYPDPSDVIDNYGADALRLYLINSPVVRGEEMRFQEDGVKDVVRRVVLPLWNAYKFFVTYARIDGFVPGDSDPPTNILDRWILSRLQSLIKKVTFEMEHYHLYMVVPALLGFIDELTNTYIRLNRRRFWADAEGSNKVAGYHVLYKVLLEISHLLAPFTPFLADTIYRNLALINKEKLPESVHLGNFPELSETLIDLDLEDAVLRMEQIILMGRNIRNKHQLKVKIPLKTLTIIHRDSLVLAHVKRLQDYLLEELNVLDMVYEENETGYISYYAKANGRTLGPKFGKDFKAVAKVVESLGYADLLTLETGNPITVFGYVLDPEDVLINRESKGGEEIQSNRHISIMLDLSVDEEQRSQGLARELVGTIQKMRKEAGFNVEDRIVLSFCGNERALELTLKWRDYILTEVLGERLEYQAIAAEIERTVELDDHEWTIGLARVAR